MRAARFSMSDTFIFQGRAHLDPKLSLPLSSGCPSVNIPFDETIEVENPHTTQVNLLTDSPVSVGFGPVTNAHIVILTADKKFRARLTSADGAAQAVPVDGILVLISEDEPITAIDLTRLPATDTKVKVFLGEKTS